MNNAEIIRSMVDRLPRGYIFTYSDILYDVNKMESVVKTLNRLVYSGKIQKISKGRFYKPQRSIFGELKPEINEIVKDLLKMEGKVIGYITGYTIFNELGLTDQVSSTIQIGRNEIRQSFIRDIYNISFIKQNNVITRDKISLLQILDSIRYIKKIPATTIQKSCSRFIKIISDLPSDRILTMMKLSRKYPPSTRALLGTIIDESPCKIDTNPLLKTLNPITTYKIPGAANTLKFSNKWNIT